MRSYTKRINWDGVGAYITQTDKYNTVNDEYVKSIIKIKILIYFSLVNEKIFKKAKTCFAVYQMLLRWCTFTSEIRKTFILLLYLFDLKIL